MNRINGHYGSGCEAALQRYAACATIISLPIAIIGLYVGYLQLSPSSSSPSVTHAEPVASDNSSRGPIQNAPISPSKEGANAQSSAKPTPPKEQPPSSSTEAADAKPAAGPMPPEANKAPVPVKNKPASFNGGEPVDLFGLSSKAPAEWRIIAKTNKSALNQRYLTELRDLTNFHEGMVNFYKKEYKGKDDELRKWLAAVDEKTIKKRDEIVSRYAKEGKTVVFEIQVPRVDGDTEDAEVAVYYFDGYLSYLGDSNSRCRGSNESEVKHLKGQFLPPEGKTIDEATKIDIFRIGIVADVLYVDMQGTFKYKNPRLNPNAEELPKSDFRRIAVFLDSEEACFFITLTGPAKTIAEQKDAFDGWIKAFK